MTSLEDTPLNFLDLETTGLSFNRDKIIEIFITKELNNKTIKTFHSLVNPGFIPDRFILNLTNISLNELEMAPSFNDIADEVFEFLNDGILVAHNARFDYSFLKSEFSQLEKIFSVDYCCTVKMFRNLYPNYLRHNLDTLRTLVDAENEEKHRAEADTNVIKKFFYSSIKDFGYSRVEDSVRYSIRKAAIPSKLLDFDFNSVSEHSGVYIFYGKDEYPLYVGMSKNLRRRVRDHLYSDTSYSKDSLINQQLTRIETIPTAGILGAALRESHLVKKLEPLYNRKLRRNSNLVKVKEVINENGMKTIILDSNTGLNKDEVGNTLLIANTLRSLKDLLTSIAKEKGLCPKLLGLEKGRGSCFSYQLGHCKGACVHKVEPEEYNRLFDETFSEYKIKEWPGRRKDTEGGEYTAPLTITEEGNGLEETFLIDNWAFLGSTLGKGESASINKFSFNYDTYKILTNFLSSKNRKGVELVNITEDVLSNYFDLY